jgi:protein-disulfide isomerase
MGKADRNKAKRALGKASSEVTPSLSVFQKRLSLSLIMGAVIAAAVIGTSLAGKPSTPPPILKHALSANTLFQGIPQRGLALGSERAPLTLVTYVDPQCPYCRAWETNVLPTLVRDYIRAGKLRVEVRLLRFLGSDSAKATGYLASASLQNKLFPMMEVMYLNQGPENSGWFSNAFINSLGNSTKNLNILKWKKDALSSEAEKVALLSQNDAVKYRVKGTPAIFLGRTGGKLNKIELSSLRPEGTVPFIKAALKVVGE